LRPPNIFTGGQRTLDEGIPSIDLIPPSPVLSHKPLNILNASQLGVGVGVAGGVGGGVSSTAGSSSSMHSVIIDDISKSSSSTAAATPIYVPTISSSAEAQSQSHSLNDVSVGSSPPAGDMAVPGLGRNANTGASTSGSSSSERLPLAPPPQQGSFKQRLRRGSSKKRRSSALALATEDNPARRTQEEEEEQHQQQQQQQLNNGGDNSFFARSGNTAVGGSSSGAKETNRLSPQNSIRRLSNTLSIGSGPVGSRRASACIFNSQVYQNLNQPPKLRPGSGQRRMSSIELAFSKTSHLNLHNLEANRKSLSYTNSKMDLDKWNKSYGNLNEPDNMLQQYMEARDKRKNSISHYNLKKRLEEKELQQLQQLHQQQLLQQRQDSFSSTTQQQHQQMHRLSKDQQQLAMQPHSMVPGGGERYSKLKMLIEQLTPKHFTTEREDYSLYIFPEDNRYVEGWVQVSP